MTTLVGYVVIPALYREVGGPEVQVGDQIKLYLDTDAQPDFPEFILGVIQHPILSVCDGKSYSVLYDEDDLEDAAVSIHPDDVVSADIVSCCDILRDDLEAEIAARIAHEADTTAHPASSIVNTPSGSISATNVQAAINELASEKQPLDSDLTAYANAADSAARRFLIGAILPTALLFDGPNPNTAIKLTIVSADADPDLDGIQLLPAGVFGGQFFWAQDGRYPTAAGQVLAKFEASAVLEIRLAGDSAYWADFSVGSSVGGSETLAPFSDAEGSLTVTLSTQALQATHLGQLCYASTAKWRWNGTVWQPFETLDGEPITSDGSGGYYILTCDGTQTGFTPIEF